MIEIFRNWIVAMLCLGILIVIIQLITPKTNLRKYIYTLVGIITVITILSPVVDVLKNTDVEESISSILSSITMDEDAITVNSDGLEDKKNELVKIQFIDNLKSDVMFKLAEKRIEVNDINIVIDEDYNIIKLELKIAKLDKEKTSINSVNEVVGYINGEYDIDYSKISVIEEGG